MSVIWSIVWGLMVLAVMLLTIRFYLPRLSARTQELASEAVVSSEAKKEEKKEVPADRKEKEEVPAAPAEKEKVPAAPAEKAGSPLLRRRWSAAVTLALCACFGAWCGYVAFGHSVSAIGFFKMTLAMGVLSCIFITDMELLMIPNLCSLILLGGRVITVICEFIWMREEALVWLFNSLLALVVSLLLLLLMSKATHGGLGMGDVKLFASLGFLCGIRAVCFSLVFAFFLCALASTVLLIARKKHLKDALPLGPFIWLGYGITVLLSIM